MNHLPHPLRKPFLYDFRADLTASDVESEGGKFILGKLKPPRGQVLVVQAFSFYAQERLNVGAPNETMRFLDPQDANGFFLYEPRIGDSAPFLLGLDYNAPRTQAGALNKDRAQGKGFSNISKDPQADLMMSWGNPLLTFLVAGGDTLRVLFSPLRVGSSTPLPGVYTVGSTGRRVDFAGFIVAGEALSDQAYRELVQESVQGSRK